MSKRIASRGRGSRSCGHRAPADPLRQPSAPGGCHDRLHERGRQRRRRGGAGLAGLRCAGACSPAGARRHGPRGLRRGRWPGAHRPRRRASCSTAASRSSTTPTPRPAAPSTSRPCSCGRWTPPSSYAAAGGCTRSATRCRTRRRLLAAGRHRPGRAGPEAAPRRLRRRRRDPAGVPAARPPGRRRHARPGPRRGITAETVERGAAAVLRRCRPGAGDGHHPPVPRPDDADVRPRALDGPGRRHAGDPRAAGRRAARRGGAAGEPGRGGRTPTACSWRTVRPSAADAVVVATDAWTAHRLLPALGEPPAAHGVTTVYHAAPVVAGPAQHAGRRRGRVRGREHDRAVRGGAVVRPGRPRPGLHLGAARTRRAPGRGDERAAAGAGRAARAGHRRLGAAGGVRRPAGAARDDRAARLHGKPVRVGQRATWPATTGTPARSRARWSRAAGRRGGAWRTSSSSRVVVPGPPAAVVRAEQPEAEAGDAGPQPPLAVGVLQPVAEEQQHQAGDEEQQGADRRRCARP